jgi:hypothetical protein
MTVGNDTYPVRIHRITGHAFILLPGEGWVPAEEASTDEEMSLPQGGRT